MATSVSLDLARFLNPAQVEAATHGTGPQLVLAGAGSGKTRVITYRIAWLVEEQGVDPAEITAVTFTNKAAAEMRERVEELLGLYPLPASVGTFHRWALVALRRYGERVGLRRDFAILDTDDQLGLVKEALKLEGLSDKAFAPRSVLSAISGAKNRLLDPEAYEAAAGHYFERKVAGVYRRYQGLAVRSSGIDFDDMIALAVRLLTEHDDIAERLRRRARWLLVDEYQDTNHAQLELIRRLAGADGNLTAVGDEDQGIYRWRGAELENILRFEDSFPGATIRRLERNYRSTQNILDASGGLIAHNQGRRGKTLWTERGTGEPIELYRATDEGDEARWIVDSLVRLRGAYKLSQMAILVRTNAQTRALEEELLRHEVPYVLVGGTRFYERAEIKDLVAYLRVLRNPRDELSLARILNQPPRGIGKTTQEALFEEAARRGQPVWDLLVHGGLDSFAPRARRALEGFRDLVVGLQEAAEELPLPALLDRLLDDTRYQDLYDPEDPDGQARRENIQELLSAAQEMTERDSYTAGGTGGEGDDDLLTAFLDHVSLVADLDTWETERGVSVMTLHSAKGLEFGVVAVGGLEDGLLPHFNAQGAREDVEEERRLVYVGMTRAEDRLMISCCRRRRVAGRYQDQMESPFLAEIPQDLLVVTQSPTLFADAPRSSDSRAAGVYGYFGRGGGGGGAAGAERSVPSFPPTAARAGRQAPFGERVADALDRTTRDAVRRGSRVRHPSLGDGVVLELEGDGDHLKYTIFFKSAGKKKMIARYANLEVL
ncbi:MAG TPA: UvrD-helicase domain-containing protein [Thermoanaerobaculia bacterium]|nr:UvrD-helicase domain-containing protein [Thermoanaerobaculia bacterium]